MVINIPEAWPYGTCLSRTLLALDQYKATPVRYLSQNKQKCLTNLASQKNKKGIIPSGDRYLWQTPCSYLTHQENKPWHQTVNTTGYRIPISLDSI